MEESFRQQLDTPCLVIDERIMRQNINDMQKEADRSGCMLRPHVKTHKIPDIAKMQMEAGAVGITCCKISEAEVMAEDGLTDIFIAYPLVGVKKLYRACALSKRIQRLILGVDSIEQATPLAKAAAENHCQLEVRVEVDCGGSRTGIERDRFASLVLHLESDPNLRLTGLYTFRGLSADTADPVVSAEKEVFLMEQYRQMAENICGRKMEVSGGSTPTGLEVARSGKVSEIRPGTYVFNDYMIHKECGTPLERMAARLLVTVVSIHKNYAVIDGGCKTFSADVSLNASPYYFDSYAYFPEKPQLCLRRLAEEHGMLEVPNGNLDLKVGDVLEAIPLHVCTVVNLQNKIYLVGDKAIHTKSVAGRGMLQ